MLKRSTEKGLGELPQFLSCSPALQIVAQLYGAFSLRLYLHFGDYW